VLYTTHYLPEVDELGGRVLMLDGGSLIADGTVRELTAEHSSDMVELTFDGPVTRFGTNGVCAGSVDLDVEDNVVRARGDAITAVTADLLRALGPEDPQLLDINLVGGSLESVYLALTGHRYRSDDQSSSAAQDGANGHGGPPGPAGSPGAEQLQTSTGAVEVPVA